MSWIQTYSGRAVCLLNPRPEDIQLIDVAHALANVCRFGGHSKVFYSVAQHSVRCSRYFDAQPRLAFQALLHDAAEAYVGDVTKPMKDLIPGFRLLEARFATAIGQRFGVELVDLPDAIKRVDLVELRQECDDLLGGETRPWSWPEWMADYGSSKLGPIVPVTPKDAKDAFMGRFLELVQAHVMEPIRRGH